MFGEWICILIHGPEDGPRYRQRATQRNKAGREDSSILEIGHMTGSSGIRKPFHL